MRESVIAPRNTTAHPAIPESADGTDARPHAELIEMMVAIWRARAVYAAAELNLADLIAGGRQTAGELADVTETHAGSIHRLLRALAACGVLTEVTTGCFALTPLGAALRSDAPGTARATVLTLGGDWQWKAWDKFLYSLRTGQPALRAAFGTSLFEYLVAHPEDGTRFNEAMIGIHGLDGPAVIAAYDFSSFKSVVDVGGGTGMLLTTILHSHESLRGTLFELPQTAPEARRLVEARGLSHRCDVIAGDFFEELPHGHDAYILAHVLHDWTDEQALPILRHCRRAIADDGRLLILESVLPPGDTPHQGKLMDLLMLTVTGGLERAAEEFATLLAAAEFKLTQAIPTSTHQTILEAVPMKRSTIVHGL